MEQIARDPRQIGAAIQRIRRQRKLSQDALGSRVKLRQATISKLEAGEPATRLSTLLDVLGALDLELIIRPRSKGSPTSIEDRF